jgi:hypothetical protein
MEQEPINQQQPIVTSPQSNNQHPSPPPQLIDGAIKAAEFLNKVDPLLSGGGPVLQFGVGVNSDTGNQDTRMAQINNPKIVKVGNKMGALILIIFGILVLGVSYLGFTKSIAPSTYHETVGTIESMYPTYVGNVKSFNTTISFNINGKSHSFTSQESALSGSNTPRYVISQTVRVAYDPANPDNKPRNVSNKASSVYGIFGIVAGVVIAGFGGLIYSVINNRGE